MPPTSTSSTAPRDGSDRPSGDVSSCSGDGTTRRVYRTRDAGPPYAPAGDRPPLRHRHPAHTGDAPGHGRRRGRRRRLRRGPDGAGPGGGVRRPGRQAGRRCSSPRGRMGNLLAVRVLARPATLVLAGRRSHIVAHEDGAAGLLNAAPSSSRWPTTTAGLGRRRGLGHRRRPRPSAGAGAAVPGEHVDARRRCRRSARDHHGSLGAGAARPPRRRPALERGGRVRRERGDVRRAGDDGDVLRVEGPLRARGFTPRRAERRDHRGPGLPAAARWGDAPGRRHRRRRARRSDDDGRTAGRGPPPCPAPRRGVADRWPDGREWVEGVRDQHRHVPPARTPTRSSATSPHGGCSRAPSRRA